MQLDKTRIAIRERTWPEILDLSLHVMREYPALLLALAAGAVPAALLNYGLLRGFLVNLDLVEEFPWFYFNSQCFLILLEIPIATAFITLYLGQALFLVKPKPRELFRQFVRCLPQLIWFQVLIRGVLGIFFLTWLVPYIAWPYLNEVILLERNPWRSQGGKVMSTSRRSSMLHSADGGNFFLRALCGAALGSMLVTALLFTLWFLRGMLARDWRFDWTIYAVALPVAEWLVAGYFAVVRYLSYLDLRIGREGWEVELRLRAERARLVPQVT